MKQNRGKAATLNMSHYINANGVKGYVEKCEPGHHTALAAFDVADPCEGSAGIDDCCETDEDAAADKDSSILFACAGAARRFFLRMRIMGPAKRIQIAKSRGKR